MVRAESFSISSGRRVILLKLRLSSVKALRLPNPSGSLESLLSESKRSVRAESLPKVLGSSVSLLRRM